LTYIISQDRKTDRALFVDTRVVDLCFEGNLRGEYLNAGRYVGNLLTVGGLNGKLSGRTRVKLKVPPLYGELGFKE